MVWMHPMDIGMHMVVSIVGTDPHDVMTTISRHVGVDVHMMYTICTHPYYILYMLTYVYILHVRSSVYILYVMLMYMVVVVCCTWCAHGVHDGFRDLVIRIHGCIHLPHDVHIPTT